MVDLIKKAGRNVLAIPGDIRDEAFCGHLVTQAVKGLGGLDILVNNAGRQQFCESIEELTTEDFDATFKTKCLRYVLDHQSGHTPSFTRQRDN